MLRGVRLGEVAGTGNGRRNIKHNILPMYYVKIISFNITRIIKNIILFLAICFRYDIYSYISSPPPPNRNSQ